MNPACSFYGHTEFVLRLGNKSRMSREVPVRFREGLGVKFPRATRLSVFVRSSRSGHRVMASVKRFIEHPLRLVINEDSWDGPEIGLWNSGTLATQCELWCPQGVFQRLVQ